MNATVQASQLAPRPLSRKYVERQERENPFRARVIRDLVAHGKAVIVDGEC